jgi:aminotransferase
VDFEKAVPQRIRENLIANVGRWRSTATGARLADLSAGMDDVVRLDTGEVGFVTPEHIREAAKEAIDAGHTGYTYLRELRVAIADKLRRDNGIEADPDTEIIVSSGCHAILAQVFAALIGPEDEVIMGTPDLYYCVNTSVHGGTPVMIPLREERDRLARYIGAKICKRSRNWPSVTTCSSSRTKSTRRSTTAE